MKTIFTVLQDIERLIYKILLWIILIPKTIIRILLDPKWASRYVKSELNEGQAHFDEYASPVILLLMVALLPSLGYNILPKFGVTLTSPAETTPTTDRFLSFEAEGNYISTSPDVSYYFEWEVLRKGFNGIYVVEQKEMHPGADGAYQLEQVDFNTVKDRYLYAFTPGEYRLAVALKHKNSKLGDKLESYKEDSYKEYVTVIIPVDNTKMITILREGAPTEQGQAGKSTANFLDRVKDEKTIFLALALMIPPLLFAFASKIINTSMDEIGEETLRESFYLQCYYFSPLSAAIWSTIYAYYFLTEDAYWYVDFPTALQILLLPIVWAVLWFIRTELKRIKWELDPNHPDFPNPEKNAAANLDQAGSENKRTVIAFLVVMACILILGYGARILLSFDLYMDSLRLFAIRAFPLAALLLVLNFGFAWFARRKEQNENVFGWNIAGLAGITIVFLVMMNQIGDPTKRIIGETPMTDAPAGGNKPTATAIVQVEPNSTQGAFAPLPQETAAPLPTSTQDPAHFYTEEFNALPLNWFEMMTYGDSRMVEQRVERGKLSVSLRPLNDKLAWYYFINDAFSYGDVEIETVVTNQGNNDNGVSLICRYSNVGWYEFTISNSGLYTIYAVDSQGIVSQGYNSLADGGSVKIKTGLETNVYTAVCKGNTLSLLVNGEEVKTHTDKVFKFAEGKIGLAVSSSKKFPVRVDFEALTISQP